MTVSVLIVNHNSAEKTRGCIESLWRGSQQPEEFVVINNGTPVPELEDFCGNHPASIIFRQVENRGFGAGVNTASSLASGDFLLVSNPDMNYEASCLKQLTAYMNTHQHVALTGPKVFNPDGSVQATARTFPRFKTFFFHRTSLLSKLFPGNAETRRYLQGAPSQTEPCQVDWIAACCMLIRRKAFDAVNGFDERYFLFMEDVDLCKRLWDAGDWEVIYNPEARATHDLGISNDLSRAVIRHRHASIRSYIRTHFGRYPWLLRKLALLAASMREKLLLMRAKK